MIENLNSDDFSDPRELLLKMKEDIKGFSGGADPFDDITMLSLYYY